MNHLEGSTAQGAARSAAVSRAIAILRLLASRPISMTAADLAAGIGAVASSTRNTCAALEAGGLIQRRDGGYVLGWGLVELGGAYLSSFEQVRQFHRASAESRLLKGELIQIAILDGTDVLYVARHEGRAPLQLSARVGDRFPAAATAVGNALLAQMGDDEVRLNFAGGNGSAMGTAKAPVDVDELIDSLHLARERGYAVDPGRVHPAVTGIAAVVPDQSSPERFAVGVSLVGQRPSDEDLARYGKAIQTLASQTASPTRRA